MSVKMTRAYSLNLHKIISIYEHISDKKNKLLCEDDNCRTEVIYVNKYERQLGDTKILVPAFFRLKSKDSKHTETCRYNVVKQIDVLARKSNNMITKNLKNGKYK